MATILKTKNSVTTTVVPTTLQQGELAVNITDKKMWVGNAATTPVQLFGAGADTTFTNISVSGVASFADGTVSLPSITNIGDTNTGIFFPAADTIAFTEGGVESMRITSAGDVGIGTSSPTSKVGVISDGAPATSGNMSTGLYVGASNSYGINIGGSSSGAYAWINAAFLNNSGTAAPLVFATGSTERMRIDSSGQLLIGATTSNGASLVISTNAGTTNWNVGPYNSVATNFYITGNNLTNGVLLSGVTATSWSALSDLRLKNVTGTYTNALKDIAQIQPVKFTWKSDTTNKPCVGVLAQSVKKVVPESIEINAMPNSEDKTEYLSVRYTELIPLMIASIQELNAKVTALEAQLGK